MTQDDADRSLPSHYLAVVDDHTKEILFMDDTSFQPIDSIKLGKGCWCGVSIHRSLPLSEDMLIAVCDLQTHTVKVFDRNTKRLVRSIGEIGHSSGPERLYNPYFLAISIGHINSVIVSSTNSSSVDVFDLDTGLHIRTLGVGRGSGIGQWNSPGGIVVWTPQDDPANTQVAIADKDNDRIQFFRLSDGSHVRCVGESGKEFGQIHLPWALTSHVPAGGGDNEALLLTAGYADGIIHILSLLSGQYLRRLNDASLAARCPYAFGLACYRPEGRGETDTQVIVSQHTRNRLEVFNLHSGENIATFTRGDEEKFRPIGVTVVRVEDDHFSFVLK